MVIAVKQQEQQKDSMAATAAMATFSAAKWPIAISCLAGLKRERQGTADASNSFV